MTLILRGSRNASATPERLPRCLKEGRQRPASALRLQNPAAILEQFQLRHRPRAATTGKWPPRLELRQGTFGEASPRWGVSATRGVFPTHSKMLTRTARLGAYCLGLDQLDPDELVTRPGLNGSCGGPIKR